MSKPYSKTRVTQSVGYHGKWVVQGWWVDTQVWADIGDPFDDFMSANQRRNEIEAES